MYQKSTVNYKIPYISPNETLDGLDEETAAQIINNQLRAGILGAAGNRVFQDGAYVAAIVDGSGTVVVTLSPAGAGLPAVQGVANDGLIEIFDSIFWDNLIPNSFYFLYLQSTADTYSDPTQVNVISSIYPLTDTSYLFLATVDTTNTDGAPPSQPVVNHSPPGKPTGFNLFSLLNNNFDPFGPSLTQTILTVLSQFTVILDSGTTSLFQQLNPDATLPVISIENVSTNPDIYSSTHGLLLGDIFVPGGFALSDAANTAYQGLAISIIGALNEILADLIAHINTDHDPHGTTLYQTNMILSGFLELPQLILNPPLLPPLPPGSPPSPPFYEIISTGELVFADERSHIALSDPTDRVYLGTAQSIIGALNELFDLIETLSEEVNGFLGSTLHAISSIVFEIVPEVIKRPLQFRLRVSEAEDFSNVIITRDTSINTVGWYFEYQPPGPPLPPSHVPDPYSLPGAILVPDPLPDPIWMSFPVSGGLPYSEQTREDGRPVRVKYEPQLGDLVYFRRRYTVGIQENNGELSDTEISSIYFG